MSVKKNQSIRLIFLDAIRGVASLLVVLSHVLGEFIPSFSITSYHRYVDPGLTGVAAFFFVSGFIIPFSLERIKSVKEFVVNRFFRIYPLYFFILIVAIFLLPINHAAWIELKNKFPQNIVFHLFLVQDYVPKDRFGIVYLVLGSWTLMLEIIWYIIFSIIYSLGLNKKNDLLIIVANIGLLGLCLIAYYFKIRIMNNRPLLIFCSFLGLYIYRYFNGEIPLKRFVGVIALSCCTITISVYFAFRFFNSPYFDFTSVIQSYTVAFLIFCIFYNFHQKLSGVIENLLAFLGRISYSFYLGHGLILFLVVSLTGKNGWLSIVSVFALSLVWAYLLFTFIETPTIAWGKRIVKKYFIKNKL